MKLQLLATTACISACVGLLAMPSQAQQHPTRAGVADVINQPLWHNAKAELIEFNAPGASTNTLGCFPTCGTVPSGITTAGVIAGTYTDSSVVRHAFVRTPAGRFFSFEAPGAGARHGLAEGTIAYSINDSDAIAGQFEDDAGVYHGFIRSEAGKFLTINVPGAGKNSKDGTVVVGSSAYDINIIGETAGVYFDAQSVEHGFVRSAAGEISRFDPRGSIATMVCQTTCLNTAGVTTGTYLDAGTSYHGFLRESNGTMKVFDAPGSGDTGPFQGTIAASINSQGVIAGSFIDGKNASHSFLRYPNGRFTVFDVPGAQTVALSINFGGTTAGSFTDAATVLHGYSRSAGGAFTTFSAPDAGIVATTGTRPSANNTKAEVTGYYIDNNYLNHGFIWIPKGTP